MSRTKELYMAAHEAEIEAYLEAHPEADEQDAYDATGQAAYERMSDRMAAAADHYRDLAKERF